MNKPPQPISGPATVPHPAPSPGLPQAAYGPGQPTSLVFATPQPPQMNSSPQPRQFAAGPRTLHQQGGYRALQGYYQNRAAMATNAPRVQTSSGQRPVGPTHVYPTSSPMMMIPQQQLPFASSPQGYYIPPGQYRTPYMPPAQQYPVTSGTASFYTGTSPAEYPAYEPSLTARERRGGGGRGSGRENGRLSLHGAPLTSQRYPAGAYYPAQPQYSPSVQPAPVMINPTQQQQQAPPPQQPPAQSQGPPKRERKPIRIRDPNQGGRDITEEIMAGGRSATTPTPPQVMVGDGGPVQTNGEIIQPVATVTRTDEKIELLSNVETPPPAALVDPQPAAEIKPEMDSQMPPPTDLCTQPEVPTVASEMPPLLTEDQPSPLPLPPTTPSPSPPPPDTEEVVPDTVDAPVGPLPPEQEVPVEQEEAEVVPLENVPEKEEDKIQEVKISDKEDQLASETLEHPVEVTIPVPPPEMEVEDDATIYTKASAEILSKSVEEDTVVPLSQKVEPEPCVPAAEVLSNGLPLDIDELAEDVAFSDTTTLPMPEGPQSLEPIPVVKDIAPVLEEIIMEKGETKDKEEDEKTDDSSTIVNCSTEETTMQSATSVPKKRRNMKELNKKEAIGDLLDAFTEDQDAKSASEPSSTQTESAPVAPVEPPAEVADETWEEKEDKQNAEPEKPNASPQSTDPKYKYKGEQWKPIDPEEKKRYDREFLLGFQFMSASMHKPEGLPMITDVVLDKVNKTPLRPADPTRMMNVGPDFTPSYLGNLGSRSMGGPRGPPPVSRRSQQGQRKETRKIISSMSLNDDVQLNKSENAWKPSVKKPSLEDDPEHAKTQELFKRLRSILNKLTPQKFQELMKQVTELTIDTEERLKGAIDLIFEKAILEPNFSVAYANMCRCLITLKVPTTDKPGVTVNFRKLLLNRCQKEFEKDQDDDEIFEKKQKELEAAEEGEERDRLKAELDDSRDKARRRSLGNIKFIGELFKLKMLTEAIMHDCVVKLLKNHDEESLECLCRLLSTIGKDLDFEKAKPRMDQYFNQMDKIIKERKTSSRIRFMLQDVLDLRRCNWVPRRGDQGPKTIDQIHKEAELEEHREQLKVQQQLLSKKDGGGGGRMAGGLGGRNAHTPGGGRNSQPQDEGWNTVPISKNRPIDTTRLSKITKPGALDFNNQLLAPGGKGMWGSWGKGSSGGSGAKPASGEQDSGRPATSTLNRFSALQQSGSLLSSDSDRRVPQRSSSSRERGGDRDRNDRDRDRFDRFDRNDARESRDNRSGQNPISKRSFSRESEERRGRGGDGRTTNEPVRRVASMTDDRDRGSRDRGNRDIGSRDRSSQDKGSRDRRSKDTGSRDRGSRDRHSRDKGSRDRGSRDKGSRDRGSRDTGSRDRGPRETGSRDRALSKESIVKRENSHTPPLSKPALTEAEVERKTDAIIEEYLHINDMKEALQCVAELNSAALLYVFVRKGVESTLERSTIAREHMGLLLQKLIKAGTLPTQQYYKGLQEILEVAEDMAIDIPHIWLYLAELITPVLLEGGIPMGQLFREISKPLLPMEKAGVLLAQILTLLCKGMSPKKVGAMWTEAGLSWSDFLAKDEDVNKFVTDQKLEFTIGEDTETKGIGTKKVLSTEELSKELERLLEDKANNQRIRDWVEANLDEEQSAANYFVRALMTCVCQSAIICENPYKVDADQINQRASLLQRFLCDEQKELQALYALQALMVHMEQPANLLRMFFDTLYDEDIIKEEAFYKWESSKDPAEQTGKGVALKSVTAFFTWLREAEEESDKD